jgi:hypothetical protein
MRSDANQPVGDEVSANQDAPNTILRGRWLLAARASWVAVATLTLGLVTIGLVVAFNRPDLIRPPSVRANGGVASPSGGSASRSVASQGPTGTAARGYRVSAPFSSTRNRIAGQARPITAATPSLPFVLPHTCSRRQQVRGP